MNENELEQKIRDELTYHLDICYGEESVRDLHVNEIMKLVRDLRNMSWRTEQDTSLAKSTHATEMED